jgi:putative protein-disulfide isomerase
LPYLLQKEPKMTQLTYLFDLLCGWCYGASARIAALAETNEVQLLPSGLFARPNAPRIADFAAQAWANDQRIAQLTGQSFSAAYRTQVLGDRDGRLDSGPATLALTAVSLTASSQELAALRAIQLARYEQGRDVTDIETLAKILREQRLDAAASLLTTRDANLRTANDMRMKVAQSVMQRLGAQGVPALVAGQGQSQRIIPSNLLWGTPEALSHAIHA